MFSASCCGLVGACSRSAVYDKTYKEIVTDTKLSDSSFIKLTKAVSGHGNIRYIYSVYIGVYIEV